MPSRLPIAKLIDHALLHPTLTEAELRAGCETARRLQVATVCVKPYAVRLAAELLRGSDVGVGTVIGFPHGGHATEVKAFEADWACQQGASELDMVVNIGKVLDEDWNYVRRDIQAVHDVATRHQAVLKVIFETDYITQDRLKQRLCEVCEEVGVDFVKTSTGFGFVKQPSGDYNYAGATEHDIRLMREACSSEVGIKASGGVRNYADAIRFRDLGATRLGSSATETIVTGAESAQEGY